MHVCLTSIEQQKLLVKHILSNSEPMSFPFGSVFSSNGSLQLLAMEVGEAISYLLPSS